MKNVVETFTDEQISIIYQALEDKRKFMWKELAVIAANGERGVDTDVRLAFHIIGDMPIVDSLIEALEPFVT